MGRETGSSRSAPTGQAAAQSPQSVQSSLTSSRVSASVRAATGQTLTQPPQ